MGDPARQDAAAPFQIAGVVAELDLDEPVGVAGEGGQGLLPHHRRQPPAGVVPGRGLDVDALEVVAVPGVGLDLRLGRRTRQGQGGLHPRGVLELHQAPDGAEVRQVRRAEVEHRDPVAEHPGGIVDHHLAAPGGGHRRQPLQGIGLVELHAEAAGRGDDAVEVGLGGGVGAHAGVSLSEGCAPGSGPGGETAEDLGLDRGVLQGVMGQVGGQAEAGGHRGEAGALPGLPDGAHVQRLDVQGGVPEGVGHPEAAEVVGDEHPVEGGVEGDEHRPAARRRTSSTQAAKRAMASAGGSAGTASWSRERPLTASAAGSASAWWAAARRRRCAPGRRPGRLPATAGRRRHGAGPAVSTSTEM